MEEAPTVRLPEESAAEARSFEAFFKDEHARLFGTLCLLTGDAREAEDLMQEAFLKLWDRREGRFGSAHRRQIEAGERYPSTRRQRGS